MSSGTRKINAFIFLAIEIANLSVSFHDDARLTHLEEVEDEDAGRDRGVFDSLNDRNVRAPGFAFWTVVFAYLSISWPAGPGEPCERLGDVQPINTSRGVQHRRRKTD